MWAASGAEDSVTTYSVDPAAANATQPAWSQITAPNGVSYKETFHTAGYRAGLTEYSALIYQSVVKKRTDYTWTQQNQSLSYPANPRLTQALLTDEFDDDINK